MDSSTAPTTDEFRAFDRLMRRLITVPKKVLDKKVAAFKRRKKKSPHTEKRHRS
jgi:hypothetical protein